MSRITAVLLPITRPDHFKVRVHHQIKSAESFGFAYSKVESMNRHVMYLSVWNGAGHVTERQVGECHAYAT